MEGSTETDVPPQLLGEQEKCSHQHYFNSLYQLCFTHGLIHPRKANAYRLAQGQTTRVPRRRHAVVNLLGMFQGSCARQSKTDHIHEAGLLARHH